MKNIIKSLVIVFAVAAVASVATYAYFSSQASVDNNTYATGTLEIQLRNSNATGHAIAGFTTPNMQPGDCVEKQFAVLNFNAANFGGSSTLAAKYLKVSSADITGDSDLCNALTLKVEANRGWATRMLVYGAGSVAGLSNADLLSPRWTELASGNSEDVYYEVCLPETGADQSTLQGKTCSFNLDTEARTN